MKLIRRLLVSSLGALAILFSVRAWAYAQENLFLEPVRENPFAAFQEHLPAFTAQEELKTPEFQTYLDFYELNFPATHHYAGWLPALKYRIFVHLFRPEGQSQGTVVALHGYFVHSAQLKYLIAALLQAGYTVIALDLPGHGLSSGARASIDDFSDYARVLEQVLPSLLPLGPKPDFIVGHSTGGAGVWEYLLRNPGHPFRKAVLAAPLVRSYLWDLSAAGFYLGSAWLQEVPRIMKPTSSDPSFMALSRRDPLQYAGTPVAWVRALIEWNDHVIAHYPPSQTPLLIFQGKEDTVVDWQYNIPFLQSKFPKAQVRWFPEANHDILWERPEIRNRLFQALLNFITSP